MNKINFNNNKNIKNKIKNSKKLLLNNSSIFSPIIKLKNKGSHKHNASIGGYNNKFNNININKNNKSNINININNIGSSEKILKNKFNIDNSNSSLPKKLGNKLNYLNINLNNLSNMNNTLNNNTQSINTFPTHINTVSDGTFNIKKNLKNKFLKKNNDSYYNKSLINSNNNIIILNNISMNNLNNISFDYLLRLTKKNYQNSYKNIASIKKQAYNYVSKEKNILNSHKELEKQREYYNNQKKLHNKKNNYKKNNRIKEQNLNGFNLKQINNILLKKNKINESINLTLNTLNNTKYKNDILITQRNNTKHNYNNSINFSQNKKIKNKSNDYHHRHNYSNNLGVIINTTNNKNNQNKNIHNNINSNNISYNNQKTINHIIKNLKGKINKNVKEKDKIIKINSAQISPKKISAKKNFKPQSKDHKSNNQKNNNKENNNVQTYIKNISRNSIKNKDIKKNNNKKDIILRNNDDELKEKKIVTEYDNKLNIVKKKINLNCLNDINEISIEGNKKIEENNKINDNNKEKVNNNERKSYQCHTIDNKIKNIEIKIIKNKGLKLKNLLNKNIKENELKEKENYENEKEELNKTNNINLLINKKEDPQLGKEYVIDIIESLLIEENYFLNEKHYIDPHYLENENSELTPEMRTVAVDWLVLIHHKIFKFQENTLFLTIQIFDRYLSKIDLNTEKTELLLLTAFMLASKHNEIDYVNMQETLQLAQNKFTKEQVIEMESEILGQINFEILAPTMMEYFKLFASFLNLGETKINHGFYVLNIVLVDFHMLEYPNFMLALAVLKLITKKNNRKLIKMIKNILEKKKLDIFLEYFEGENYEEIYDICSKIKLLYNTFLETKYKNIQEKFAESKYNCVSSFTSI